MTLGFIRPVEQVAHQSDPSAYNRLIKAIEEELYQAIEALEQEDLVRVRQSMSRALFETREAWRVR